MATKTKKAPERACARGGQLDEARAAIDDKRDRDLAGLAELEDRLQLAESSSDEPEEPDTTERDALQGQVGQARQAEMDARLAVRTGEERVRAVHGRADQLLLQVGYGLVRLLDQLGAFVETTPGPIEQGFDLDQAGGNVVVGHAPPPDG